MSATCLLLAVAGWCYLLYWYATRTYGYWASRNVAGPKPVPVFGNLWDSALRRKNIAVVHKEIYEQFPDEKMVGLYQMTTPCLMLRDLDLIKSVLIKDFDYFSGRGISFSDRGLGNNLFFVDSDKWWVLRKYFTPTFTSGKLKNMVYLLEQCGDSFVGHVQELLQTGCEHEVHSLAQRYTFETIWTCIFGLDVNTLKENIHVLKKVDRILFSTTFFDELEMMFPGILRKWKLEPFPTKVENIFMQIFLFVVAQRNGAPTERNDLMDLILEMRQQSVIHEKRKAVGGERRKVELTDDICAAQMFAFYTGGYETSAATISFMLYELAKNTHVQDKLIAEVDEVLGKHGGRYTLDALNELTYMEKVFSEILRLYPVVALLQRRALRPYRIPGSDVIVKKGQMVYISSLAIHHDEKYYPDPEKFDPERFSTGNCNRHSSAYLPFGIGPRNCIGFRFGSVQVRVCMAKFLRKYRVEPTARTPATLNFSAARFILRTDGGIYLNIIPRKN